MKKLLAAHPNGKYFAVEEINRTVVVRTWPEGRKSFSGFVTNGEPKWAVFIPKADELLVGTSENAIIHLRNDGKWGEEAWTYYLHWTGAPATVSPDGRYFAITAANLGVLVFDLQSHLPVWQLSEALRNAYYFGGFTENGHDLTVAGADCIMHYHLPTQTFAGTRIALKDFVSAAPERLRWSSDGRALTVSTISHNIGVYWPTLRPLQKPDKEFQTTELESVTEYGVTQQASPARLAEWGEIRDESLLIRSPTRETILYYNPIAPNRATPRILGAVPWPSIPAPGPAIRRILPASSLLFTNERQVERCAERDRLNAELDSPKTVQELPKEWRYLLKWWTTKPGERGPFLSNSKAGSE